MEYLVLRLTKLLGQPEVIEHDDDDNNNNNNNHEEEEESNETLIFHTQFEKKNNNFSIVITYPHNEQISIQCEPDEEGNSTTTITTHISEEELEHLLSLKSDWETLMTKPFEICKLQSLLPGCSVKQHVPRFGCWTIDHPSVSITNNPFGWTSVQESTSTSSFHVQLKHSSSNDMITLENEPIEQVIHRLNQQGVLTFDWSSEISQDTTSSCFIWKIDLSDDQLFDLFSHMHHQQQEEEEEEEKIDLDQILLFQMTDARDRWAKIVRDQNFQIWKCYVGIPVHNQSVIYEQSHTMIQYLETVENLTLHKLTFSGKMKHHDLSRQYFTTDSQFQEFLEIGPDEIWWFGFDFNHTPISHYQVFEAMKQKKFANVPTLGQYLVENPEDFNDVSPLEYSTPNWIKTSLDIDQAVPTRSYKNLETCRQVVGQVNQILFRNEEIFLQLLRIELAQDEDGDEDPLGQDG